MDGKIKYTFLTKMWRHDAPGGWHFVSLPKGISTEIRENLKWQEQGWGRMTALAKIDNFEWETAIWFDTKLDAYLLPIKAKIRAQANLATNEDFTISIWV